MAAYRRVYDSHCRLTAKNRDQLRNRTLGNRVWATSTFIVTERCLQRRAYWPATGCSINTPQSSLPPAAAVRIQSFTEAIKSEVRIVTLSRLRSRWLHPLDRRIERRRTPSWILLLLFLSMHRFQWRLTFNNVPRAVYTVSSVRRNPSLLSQWILWIECVPQRYFFIS